MGIFNSDVAGHEGFTIGYVDRDGVRADSGLYRELSYPADTDERPVALIAAGCDCGWRSSRWRPTAGTAWMPHIVDDSEEDHEKVTRLWKRHIALDVTASPPRPDDDEGRLRDLVHDYIRARDAWERARAEGARTAGWSDLLDAELRTYGALSKAVGR